MKFVFGVPCILALTACASIHSVESTTDTPLRPLIGHEVEADSLEHEVVSSSVDGYNVRVVISQSERCTTVTTSRVHRRRYVERHVDANASRATWGLALTSVAAGLYGYVDAENLAAGSTTGTTADEYRQYSGGMVALGVVAGVIGVIDAVRAHDSEFDDGVIKGQPTRDAFACRRHRSRDTDVSLILANDYEVHARTDEHGVAGFSFLNVPDEGLPTLDTRVRLSVDGETTPLIGFESQERSLIRQSLMAEPRSRLATQILERRREACSIAVSAARALVPAEPTRVPNNARPSWLAAKSRCAELWEPRFDAELLALEVRIVNEECRERLGSADAAFADDSTTTVGEMNDELATLHGLCTTQESVAKLSKLDAKLAATVKRIEREVAAEARRAAREKARAAAAYREAVERARAQRSFNDTQSSWPGETTRSCCKMCSTGKACGDSCISRSKTCHKGVGCACDY